MPFEDLLDSVNTLNDKGLGPVIYMALKKDITSLPAFTSSPTTEAQKNTRTGTFTMVASKTFKQIKCTPGTGEVVTKPVGSGPKQLAFESTIEFSRANLDAEILGFLNGVANEEVVIVAPDNSGFQVIMGDNNRGAFLSADSEVKTGKAAADDRGAMIKFVYSGRIPSVWAGTPPLV